MKVRYDEKTDTLSVILRSDVPVAESDEEKPGLILDYDAAGNLVALRDSGRISACLGCRSGRLPTDGVSRWVALGFADHAQRGLGLFGTWLR